MVKNIKKDTGNEMEVAGIESFGNIVDNEFNMTVIGEIVEENLHRGEGIEEDEVRHKAAEFIEKIVEDNLDMVIAAVEPESLKEHTGKQGEEFQGQRWGDLVDEDHDDYVQDFWGGEAQFKYALDDMTGKVDIMKVKRGRNTRRLHEEPFRVTREVRICRHGAHFSCDSKGLLV